MPDKDIHNQQKTGFRLTHGIWDFEHNINSRDVARPEYFRTREEVNAALQDWRKNYYKMGYEIWFSETKEIPVRECSCGHIAEVIGPCWYCGKTSEVSDDAKQAINTLTKKVNSLEKELKETKGECQECGRKVKDWKPPFGSFAPELWATLREQGIDPISGHSLNCSRRH